METDKEIEELKNKKLMTKMWIITIISITFYFSIIFITTQILEEGFLFNAIIIISTIIFIILCLIAFKFEVKAGYYECKKCHYKFIPTYKEALFAMHIGTTRYLKCSKCNKRRWSKKILTKLT